jgi:hypothetical protein
VHAVVVVVIARAASQGAAALVMRLCVADESLGSALERRVAIALLSALRAETAQLGDTLCECVCVIVADALTCQVR